MEWIFGGILCRLFYILTSLNWFTSVFTLTVMAADRYLAVCHAIESRRYRTPTTSRVVCVVVWIASLLVMFPIYLYCRTVTHDGRISCTILWPEGQVIAAEQAFIWYAFFLGFAIPVCAISVFYCQVVIRLSNVGPNKQTRGKQKSRRKVTRMVLTVIAVYVVCWLPYWLFQIIMLFVDYPPSWTVPLFQLITVLSYANSAVNPILYAFLSDNFRRTFARAFGCATADEVDRTLHKSGRQSTIQPEYRSGTMTAALRLGSLRTRGHVTTNEKPEAEVDAERKMETEMQVLLHESNVDGDSPGISHPVVSTPPAP